MSFSWTYKSKLALSVFSLFLLSPSEGCTMVGVGRNATVDGSTLMAHTDDAGGGAADVRLIRVPAMDHPKGSKRNVYNLFGGYPRVLTNQRGKWYLPTGDQNLSEPLGTIPQVNHTYAYFDQDYGMMNEVQLSIGESTCAAKTVGWPSDVPYGYNLFGIAELSKVALERCDSARCAIQTMGDLAVEYGFYSEDSGNPLHPGYSDSAEALGIADKYGEVWVFHVLTGPKNASAVWAAQRVPDNHITAVANAFVIRQMDLEDPDNFMASSNVVSFAQEMGWYNENDGPFDFTAAYTYNEPGPLLPLYAGRRVWRIFDVFAPSLKLDSTLGFNALKPTYPFSVKPDQLVNITTLMELLRDHYEGTPYDMTKGIAAGPFGSPIRYDGPSQGVTGGWERPISMYRTMFSFVLQSRGDLEDAIGGTVWYGQDAPHGSVYVPFSCRQDVIPKSYILGKESEFNSESSWWVFNFVNNWSMLRYNMISLDIKSEINRLQSMAFQNQRDIMKKYSSRNIGTEVLQSIQQANNEFAETVYVDWWKLAWRLVAKFSDGYIVTGEKPTDMKMPGYPSWWLQISEFSKWPGNTYKQPTTTTATTKTIRQELHTTTQPTTTTTSPTSTTSGMEIFGYVCIGMFIGATMLAVVQKYRHRGYESI